MIRLIKSRDYVRKPWKNGGGTLADIVMAPEGAGLDAFDWRISAAHVGMDGPFSMFPGIDRSMVILSGEGMQLDIAGRPPVMLGVASAPLSFPGDVPTHATLTAGPIDDLNVMTKRGRFTHTVRRVPITTPQMFAATAGGAIIIYVEAGKITADAGEMVGEVGDTLVARAPTQLTGAIATRCCVIEITKVAL